jgi:hypothetical protein
MKTRRKVFHFGKVAFYGKRKVNAIDVEMEYRYASKGMEFAVSGEIWNSKHTDIVRGGQCLDEIKKYRSKDKLFNEIYDLWKKYHLNSMHPGTPAQESALKDFDNICDYDACCRFLESKNLLIDDGYKYGTAWLYRAIPQEDEKRILALLEK